jgi:hypothetical protein
MNLVALFNFVPCGFFFLFLQLEEGQSLFCLVYRSFQIYGIHTLTPLYCMIAYKNGSYNYCQQGH